MKKKITVFILIISMTLFAVKNWECYTNTSHIYDVEKFENKLYFATWGGLLCFNPATNNFEKTYTIVDGMGENDIRSLNVFQQRNELLIGTYSVGIDRLTDGQFTLPLTWIMGLASDKVNKIVSKDSLIFAATENGLSVFRDAPNFPYPLPINSYNFENGLSVNDITSLQISDDGYIFCGSDFGLDFVHIDSMSIENSWRCFNSSNSIFPSSIVNDISVRDDKVVVGTREGLVVSDFPNFEWIVYDSFFDRDDISIFPIYIDNAQNIFAGIGYWDDEKMVVEDTTDIAIFKFSDGQIQEFWCAKDMNISNTQIMGFEEIDGNIFAYTWGEGFFQLDENISEWEHNKPNCIGTNLVTDIEIDKNDKIWISNGIYGLESNSRCAKGLSCLSDDNWKLYNKEQYPNIKTNNILDIEIDENNKKWITCWQSDEIGNGGVTVFDEENDFWQILSDLSSTYYTSATSDEYDKMWLSSSQSMDVVNINDFNDIDGFETPAQEGMDNYVWCSLISDNKTYFGYNSFGLKYWNASTFPETDGNFWEDAPSNELQEGKIYQIVESKATSEEQIWIASSSGLFMFDGTDWFKYGVHIKKKVWQSGGWYDEATSEYWYFEGQERLFGGQNTYPTALFVDPFGVIWIGTHDAGITVYNLEENIFTNYTTENCPLISNSITDFAYNPVNSILYIGTTDGLNSVQIGISPNMNTETILHKPIIFPNPFSPEKGEILKIENSTSTMMPKGDTKCSIYNLNGDLIRILTKNEYQQFEWNGTNKTGQKCSSGIYFYLIFTPDGQIEKGKFALIR